MSEWEEWWVLVRSNGLHLQFSGERTPPKGGHMEILFWKRQAEQLSGGRAIQQREQHQQSSSFGSVMAGKLWKTPRNPVWIGKKD